MLIKIHKFQYKYPTSEKIALHFEGLEIQKSERVFIKGASGSGKSTLLNLLSGVLAPPKASIFFEAQDLSELTQFQRDHLRANQMGIVFQQFNLLPFLTAKENVLVPFIFSKNVEPQIEQRAIELFTHLRLEGDLVDRPIHQLSVGQQQRVAVVRALIHKPSLILADEPTSSLDTDARDDFIQLLLKESREIGAAVVFVSHDPSLEKYFDKSIKLSRAGAS